MTQPTPDMDRLVDLLADDTLGELSETDARDLVALSQRFPGHRVEAFDHAASLLQVALLEAESGSGAGGSGDAFGGMPPALRARTEAAMLAAVRSKGANPGVASGAAPGSTPRGAEHRGQAMPEIAGRVGSGGGALAWLGWAAAAACLFLAAAAWINRPIVTTTPGPMGLSAEQRLSALLAMAPQDLVRVDWVAPGEDPAAGGFRSGEVVWSDALNEGYMVFEGLAANDPSAEQYQLWIFDAARNEAHPVDGGVFDIAASDRRVVVPIDPRVPVDRAVLFAVTVEPPGGVVVSSRERLPLVAPVEGG
ncbi:MAG: anti-sigma factor domain-containing protein [Phycisphaerales bacterium]